jgi:hypothetical protein
MDQMIQVRYIGVYSSRLGTKVMSIAQPILEALEIFRTNKLANEWRSATFQSAYSSISNEDPAFSNDTSSLSSTNLDSAIRGIQQLFNTISQYTSQRIPDNTPEIRQTVKLAREIALQFGIHPATLQLYFQGRNDTIEIGTEFYDCNSGTMNAGEERTIDIATCPGLRKIGDGKLDMESVLTIVPCEIIPK